MLFTCATAIIPETSVAIGLKLLVGLGDLSWAASRRGNLLAERTGEQNSNVQCS